MKELTKQVCIWFHSKFKIPFFKRDMILGPIAFHQKDILSYTMGATWFTILKKIWLTKNEAIFQQATNVFKIGELTQECTFITSHFL